MFQPVNGRGIITPSYSIRLGEGYRREIFPLHTANRKEAARAAKEIDQYRAVHGLAATLEHYKSKRGGHPAHVTTLGQYVEMAEKLSGDLKRATFTANVRHLRTIVSQIFDLDPGTAKYDPRTDQGGRAEWIAGINEIRLDQLTPERLAAWRAQFIAQAGNDQKLLRRRRLSAESILRQAGSLFKERLLEEIAPEGFENPFKKLPRSFRPRQRYRSEFEFTKLVQTAFQELASSDSEAFKAFLLMGFAGLRRSEADSLRWEAFHWDEGFIRIAVTSDFGGKNEESLSDVYLEPEVIALFKTYRAEARGSFVLESDRKPKANASWARYRALPTFKRLIEWLRTQGLDNEKPLHTLRKEFGAQLARKHGILAASIGLRHCDISVTRSHYVDDHTKATVGLGHLIRCSPLQLQKGTSSLK